MFACITCVGISKLFGLSRHLLSEQRYISQLLVSTDGRSGLSSVVLGV